MAEVYAFPEGKLYLFAAYSAYWSAYLTASGTGSGTASASASALLGSALNDSGNAIGFAQGSTLAFNYGWKERYHDNGVYRRGLTAQYAQLSIDYLLSNQALYTLANSRSAVNARFEGYNSGTNQTAQWTLYSGVIESLSLNQSDGSLFNSTLSIRATEWSATGG